MKLRGKWLGLGALAAGGVLLLAVVWPSFRAGNGVMSLHLQTVTTNESGLPKYVFVLTNNAYDCVALSRVMVAEAGGRRASLPYGFPPVSQRVAVGESASFVFESPKISEWLNHAQINLAEPGTWKADIQCQRVYVPSLWETMERLNARLELTVGFPRVFRVERGRSVQSQAMLFLSDPMASTRGIPERTDETLLRAAP